MSNPLIDKFYELHPEKKEEPKKEFPKEYKGQFITHDIDSINDSFLQIAEKVKNKEAQVCTMNMDYDHQSRTQRITFEILTNF